MGIGNAVDLTPGTSVNYGENDVEEATMPPSVDEAVTT
jgi:hypothetical protein